MAKPVEVSKTGTKPETTPITPEPTTPEVQAAPTAPANRYLEHWKIVEFKAAKAYPAKMGKDKVSRKTLANVTIYMSALDLTFKAAIRSEEYTENGNTVFSILCRMPADGSYQDILEPQSEAAENELNAYSDHLVTEWEAWKQGRKAANPLVTVIAPTRRIMTAERRAELGI